MVKFRLPYSRGHVEFEIPEGRLRGVLQVRTEDAISEVGPEQLVIEALRHPIDSPSLANLSRHAERVLLLTSDHTRPLPSRITVPLILEEIQRGNRRARVTILVATGCHRPPTREELSARFGLLPPGRVRLLIHDCRDHSALAFKGLLPSGGPLWLNSAVDESDLTVAEGVIEPHFFAGFSGGRKSVLPGIAGESTVHANHCAKFIADPAARAGNLAGNPVHDDMVYAARVAGLRFILNVTLNRRHEINRAFAGHPETAHEAGCRFVSSVAEVPAAPAEIVIASNGGYPLDQNIYQAVKGMKTAAQTAKEPGVIIMVSACEDGHGGQAFYNWFQRFPGPDDVARAIAAIPQDETAADQWEAQILAEILRRHKVILVTDRCSPAVVAGMHLLRAASVEEALSQASALVGEAGITVVPDGVSVIVRR